MVGRQLVIRLSAAAQVVTDYLVCPWGAIAGADFFTTDVWTRRGLVTVYTVFVIHLASHRVKILGSTAHPDEAFMRQSAAL